MIGQSGEGSKDRYFGSSKCQEGGDTQLNDARKTKNLTSLIVLSIFVELRTCCLGSEQLGIGSN